MLNNQKLACYLVFGCLVTGSISNGHIDSREGDADVGKLNNDAGTSSLELGGRLALVTGAASGIGRSVAMVLARENVTVIVADMNKTGGDATVGMLPNKHLKHTAMYVDVRNSTSIKDLVECIETTYEMNISIVVNSAGILHRITPLVNLSEEIFDDVINTNLKGTFLVTKEAVKHMLSRNVTGAAIVNIASILGKGGFPGLGAYTASKGGVIAFTKSVALELATKGIRVNVILPGLTDTPMIQKYSSSDITKRLAAMIPMKRIAQPIEISETILFMCSPKTSYMTGASIDVAGGTQT
ncbi:3-oxoacyl-[acyl-carrier-protein] reductase FabG-like [Ixodes scapularis]|uniref:3-oxoacyl-[acyl-carrier-protein] reductase FabG-like n=1 Tax=Ixodes scapularis TaxID=6945 RepID=UPI001A9D94C0|nr:3-oxoacyl-[acyl-carrier-protein] reductase FabG-like [Ixodes scapularis]